MSALETQVQEAFMLWQENHIPILVGAFTVIPSPHMVAWQDELAAVPGELGSSKPTFVNARWALTAPVQ